MEKEETQKYSKYKQSLDMDNENVMENEEKQRYTICKKSLNTNIKKTLGKNRGTLSAKNKLK